MLYILDTSIIRSAGGDCLRAAAARGNVAISPMTTYELISHLQDADADGEERGRAYRRARGHLRICCEMKLLDDPHLHLMRRVGAAEVVHSSRFEEAKMLGQVLDHLAGCETLEEFHAREVEFPDRSRGSCKDLGLRVERTLHKMEQDYIQRAEYMYKLLLDRVGAGALDRVSGEGFIEVVESGSRILDEHMDRIVGTDPERRSRVISAMYPHLGYVVGRTIIYARKARFGQDIVVDGNDAEDGAICLHCDLFEESTLVTQDKGTHEALGQALAAIQERAERAGESYDPRCRAINLATYREEAGV